jgi:predicted nucleic acid-binding protein
VVRGEPPAEQVSNVLQQADAGELQLLMSWMNAGEVYYMLARKHDAPVAEEFLARLPSLPIRLVVPQEEDIIAAARLKATRRLAYADAFAAALTQRENPPS